MWPFSKKWSPPAPQLAMLVSMGNQELPSLVALANPGGVDGAVPGMAGPTDAPPTPENMMSPMKAGTYLAVPPGGGSCAVQVERVESPSQELSFHPLMMEASGLTAEMLAKFNKPVWRAMVVMHNPGKEVRDTVVFATRLAQRLAALGDGVVLDKSACRFFGPAGWRVEGVLPEFDAREHVHIHIESESCWFHTHGLVKFGRPEMEIYDVPRELDQVAYATLLDISQYVITSAVIEPGQTCGDPSRPFHAREGTRNRKGHWEDLAVLELVDVDERRKPVASGAAKALKFMADNEAG